MSIRSRTCRRSRKAITELPDDERHSLAIWFNELDYDEWDREMVKDFSPGGRGYHLFERVKGRSQRAKVGQWKTEFCDRYNDLPEDIQRRADKQLRLFMENPQHPSIQLKPVGAFWTARVERVFVALDRPARRISEQPGRAVRNTRCVQRRASAACQYVGNACMRIIWYIVLYKVHV